MGTGRSAARVRAYVVATLVAASCGAESAAAAEHELYPDLKTAPPTDLARTTPCANLPGAFDCIIFTNIVLNAGAGALEIRGGEIQGDSREAIQRVNTDGGSYRDIRIGSFTHHSAHGHVHLDDFAHYELWHAAAYDAWLASGRANELHQPLGMTEKVSFCLLDSIRFRNDARKNPFYWKCDDKRQGISAGWGDVYGRALPGQSVTVSGGIKDGAYVLRSVADPLNAIHESGAPEMDPRDSVADNEAIRRFVVCLGAVHEEAEDCLV